MPCRAELPHLAELAETFEAEPVSIIAALQGGRTQRVDELVEENSAMDVFCTDESGDASEAYGVHGVPTTVIIDHAGRLMFRHVGFSEGDEERLVKEIKTLLAWMNEA